MKLAMITGASSGLGLAMTEELLAQGWYCITIQRSTRGLEGLLKEYGVIQMPLTDSRRQGRGALEVIHQDLRDCAALPEFLEGLYARVLDLLGTSGKPEALWLILNAATLDPVAPLAQADSKALENHLSLNLLSPMIFISAFERIFASVAGRAGFAGAGVKESSPGGSGAPGGLRPDSTHPQTGGALRAESSRLGPDRASGPGGSGAPADSASQSEGTPGVPGSVRDAGAGMPGASREAGAGAPGASQEAGAGAPGARAETLRVDKRIIAVSSGAALHAYPGWAAYCASKAGLDQVMDAAAQEAGVSGSGTFFRAIAPGVVDTPMQEVIRSRGPEQFPMVQRFRDLYSTGGLSSPAQAAAKVLSLAAQGEEGYLRLDVRTA